MADASRPATVLQRLTVPATEPDERLSVVGFAARLGVFGALIALAYASPEIAPVTDAAGVALTGGGFVAGFVVQRLWLHSDRYRRWRGLSGVQRGLRGGAIGLVVGIALSVVHLQQYGHALLLQCASAGLIGVILAFAPEVPPLYRFAARITRD